MATNLKRLEFKQEYKHYLQGLFIAPDERRLPKDQTIINLGQELSKLLIDIPIGKRKERVTELLEKIVGPYKSVSLTHIDVLFTPYLELDPIGALLKLCRNRKVCIIWPGTMAWNTAYYADPNDPEYFDEDLSKYQDTYIIE